MAAPLLRLLGPFQARREAFLAEGESFFERHGPKAVFLGRWTAVLRIAVAWLAGAHKMRWSTFSFWNALGGIAWASVVGLLAYMLGAVVERFFAVRRCQHHRRSRRPLLLQCGVRTSP